MYKSLGKVNTEKYHKQQRASVCLQIISRGFCYFIVAIVKRSNFAFLLPIQRKHKEKPY